MANRVDPDQTPHYAASDLGLHSLQRHICPNRVITVSKVSLFRNVKTVFSSAILNIK